MDKTQRAITLLMEARQHIEKSDISTANDLLNEAVGVDDRFLASATYLFLNGIINAMAGRIGAAEKYFLEAIRQDRKQSNAMEELGNLYLKLGKLEEAGRYLMKSHTFKAARGREDVFVFGDSHAQACFGGISRCKVQWLGAVTMHRVGRDGLSFLDFGKFGVPDGATVVLVFGEIDARVHVLRQRDGKGRELDEIVGTLVDNYVAVAIQNKSRYADLRVALCSVVPPTNAILRPEHDMHGTLQERREVVRMMNERLFRRCRENGLTFLDIHKYLVDWNGYMNRAYADSNVHAHPNLCDIFEYEMIRAIGLQ